MAKGSNGTWKVIGTIAALSALILAVAGLVWNASTISSELVMNVKADGEMHPQIPRNQIAIAELNKDMQSQQRDLGRIESKLDAQAAAQDAILEMQKKILEAMKR